MIAVARSKTKGPRAVHDTCCSRRNHYIFAFATLSRVQLQVYVSSTGRKPNNHITDGHTLTLKGINAVQSHRARTPSRKQNSQAPVRPSRGQQDALTMHHNISVHAKTMRGYFPHHPWHCRRGTRSSMNVTCWTQRLLLCINPRYISSVPHRLMLL